MVDALARFTDDPACSAAISRALKCLAVNDRVCRWVSRPRPRPSPPPPHSVVASHGGLDSALVVLASHSEDTAVAMQASALVRALVRTDGLKETIGRGEGLPLLLNVALR